MAYRCNFLDNQVYSSSDVNDVFSCLTSGGVMFSADDNVITALNETSAQIVGEGVLSDATSCKVIKEEEVYKILPGACFMNDGSVIIISNGGETISVPKSVKSYVYFERNHPKNSIDIVVSENAGGEESVPLAEISEKGEIFDRRKYAASRVMVGISGVMRNASAEFTQCTFDGSEKVSVDMGSGNFSYIVIWGGTYTSSLEKEEPRVSSGKNLERLSEDEEISLLIGRYETKAGEFVYAKKNGQYLELQLLGTISGGKYTLNFAVI